MTRIYYNFEGTGCANANEIEYLKQKLAGPSQMNFTAKMLYKASLHGFDPRDAHSKADGFANTITLLKLKSGVSVAAYTSLEMSSPVYPKQPGWFTDYEAFLLNLSSKLAFPSKGGQYGGIGKSAAEWPSFGRYELWCAGGSLLNEEGSITSSTGDYWGPGFGITVN